MITILGKNSQLAQCLIKKIKCPINILSSNEIDFRDYNNIEVVLSKFSNKIIINCFAFNDVEDAESNQDAYKINHIGLEKVAKFCAKNNIVLIHISTDFIFDGNKGHYIETDPANPINHYGKSKALGELSIQKHCRKYIILRTSWLYSHLETKNNFLFKIKTLALEDKKDLFGAEDIVGSPTSSLNLADGIYKLLESIDTYDFSLKLFHFSDLGSVSRFTFLEEIVKKLNLKFNLSNSVHPTQNSYFNLIAPRPYNTSLNSSLFSETFNFRSQDWKKALNKTIELL